MQKLASEYVDDADLSIRLKCLFEASDMLDTAERHYLPDTAKSHQAVNFDEIRMFISTSRTQERE